MGQDDIVQADRATELKKAGQKGRTVGVGMASLFPNLPTNLPTGMDMFFH